MNRGYAGRSGGVGASGGGGGGSRRQNAAPAAFLSLPSELAYKSLQEVTMCINPGWDDVEDDEQLEAAVAKLKADQQTQQEYVVYQLPKATSTPIVAPEKHDYGSNATSFHPPVSTPAFVAPTQTPIIATDQLLREVSHKPAPPVNQGLPDAMTANQLLREVGPQQCSIETPIVASSTASSGSQPIVNALAAGQQPLAAVNDHQKLVQVVPLAQNGYQKKPVSVAAGQSTLNVYQPPPVPSINGSIQRQPQMPIPTMATGYGQPPQTPTAMNGHQQQSAQVYGMNGYKQTSVPTMTDQLQSTTMAVNAHPKPIQTMASHPATNDHQQQPPVPFDSTNGHHQRTAVPVNGYHDPQPPKMLLTANGNGTSILPGNGFGPVPEVSVTQPTTNPSVAKKVNKKETVKSYLSNLPPPAVVQKPEKTWPIIDNPVKEFIAPPSPIKTSASAAGQQHVINISISSNAMNGDADETAVFNASLMPQIVISSNAPLVHSIGDGLSSDLGAAQNRSGSGFTKEDLCSIATVSQKLFEAYAEMNALFERLSARL